MTAGSGDSIANQASLFQGFRKQLQRPTSESKVANFLQLHPQFEIKFLFLQHILFM